MSPHETKVQAVVNGSLSVLKAYRCVGKDESGELCRRQLFQYDDDSTGRIVIKCPRCKAEQELTLPRS